MTKQDTPSVLSDRRVYSFVIYYLTLLWKRFSWLERVMDQEDFIQDCLVELLDPRVRFPAKVIMRNAASRVATFRLAKKRWPPARMLSLPLDGELSKMGGLSNGYGPMTALSLVGDLWDGEMVQGMGCLDWVRKGAAVERNVWIDHGRTWRFNGRKGDVGEEDWG